MKIILDQFEPIADRRIRIALVGCGRISHNHIRAISLQNERAELVAMCDSVPDSIVNAQKLIEQVSAENNIESARPDQYTSYSRMLSEVSLGRIYIDLLVLTTPSGLHAGQVIAAAKAGIHVCTEKPMATRWADGLSMVKACDDAGVYLFVVKQNRFNKTLQLLKKQIQNGRFGRLSMVVVNVFWQRPQEYYDQASWRGTKEFDGGALMNQASHYVDLLEWLIGPVESVSALIATIGRNIEVEDTAALQIKWRNGALGNMAVTMLTYPKNLEGSITILGETGTVKIGGPAVNKIEHWDFADENQDDELVDDASYQTTSVYGFGHPLYYSNMLDTLQGKAEAQCDGREGLKSLELLTGAYRSARDKKPIYFPLDYS